VLLGILIGFAQIGVLSGPLIGGVLTQYVTWRWCKYNPQDTVLNYVNMMALGFYINLPIGGLAVPLLFFVTIPSNKKTEGETMIDRILKLDLIGFFFFAPAAIQLVLALEWGGTKFAWSSSTVIGLFCGTFGTTLVFVAWEYHMGKKAMIPLAIIRRLVIWSSCAFMAFFMGSMLSATYYLPVYFQSVRNAKPSKQALNL
jgi:MFS family permease